MRQGRRQVTFAQVLTTTQRGSSHSSMIKDVAKTSLQIFPASPQQRLAALALHRSPRSRQSRTHLLGRLRAAPMARRIDDHRAHRTLLQDRHLAGGKVSFVGCHFLRQTLYGNLGCHRVQESDGAEHPLGHLLTVRQIPGQHLRTEDRPAVEIVHVLGLVNQVGRSVLGPAHLRVGIVARPPSSLPIPLRLLGGFTHPVLLVLRPSRRLSKRRTAVVSLTSTPSAAANRFT